MAPRRNLVRFTGADTISAHMLDPARTALFPSDPR
jgi:hypothetical protein